MFFYFKAQRVTFINLCYNEVTVLPQPQESNIFMRAEGGGVCLLVKPYKKIT